MGAGLGTRTFIGGVWFRGKHSSTGRLLGYG